MFSRVILAAAFVGAGLCAPGAQAQDIWTAPKANASASTARRPAGHGEPAVKPAPGTPAPVAAAAPVTPTAPQAPSANATYSERVLAGIRQIVLRDFDGALATLREAAQLEPATPAAFCHLGDAELAKADWNEAKAAYETCARFANLAKDARYVTLALVGTARATELSQGSLSERRDAYVRLDGATTHATAKALAAARIAVFDGLIALDAEYAAVRKRIAERAALPKP